MCETQFKVEYLIGKTAEGEMRFLRAVNALWTCNVGLISRKCRQYRWDFTIISRCQVTVSAESGHWDVVCWTCWKERKNPPPSIMQVRSEPIGVTVRNSISNTSRSLTRAVLEPHKTLHLHCSVTAWEHGWNAGWQGCVVETVGCH